MKFKYLVIGGSGFIGTNLCKALLQEGNEVICIDNLSSSNMTNVNLLKKFKKYKYVPADIANTEITHDATMIYNLASPTAPGDFKRDPIATLKSNVLGVINILESAVELKIPVVHLSTVRVHETDHLNKNACYTEGKRVAETICNEYSEKYGLDIKIVRLFSIYGKHMAKHDSRVIPQFITKALNNEDITLWGDGTQEDSFLYVDDLISLLLTIRAYSFSSPITIGNKKFISIKYLAKQIIKLTESKSKIKFVNPDFKAPVRNDIDFYNISDIWEQKVSLTDGLIQTIQYYTKLIK